MKKQNEIWTVKGKYPSRFYSPGYNCVSSLLPVWSLIPHLWVQASGTTDREEDFFFFFLTCSSVNWKQFEIGIMSGLGFHVVDNSVSFQNECWSLGIPEHAQQCKRTSVIRWARESCQHENLTQDPNFRGNFGPGDRTLCFQWRGPEFDPWSGN